MTETKEKYSGIKVGETYGALKVLSGHAGWWGVQCVLCGDVKERVTPQIVGSKARRCHCQVLRKSKTPKIGDIFGLMEVIGPRVKGKWLLKCTQCGLERRHSSAQHYKQCGNCTLVRHPIGEIIYGRKVVAGRKNRGCGSLTMECLFCGARAQVNPAAKRKSKCRVCAGWNSRLSTIGEIYALTCPYTAEVKYVGATNEKSYQRAAKHFNHRNAKDIAHKPLYRWLQELAAEGAAPGVILLEKVSGDNVHEREIFWINKTISEGCKLFNLEHSIGGLY